jgi:DNA-binding response OmpR family regulator
MAAVLVIDDDPDLLDAISLVLREEGHQVLTASTDSDAVALARTHEPLVTLVDYRMPGVDARKLIALLRRVTGSLMVLCTAADQPQAAAEECGADALLPKPFNIDQLLGLMRRRERELTPQP